MNEVGEDMNISPRPAEVAVYSSSHSFPPLALVSPPRFQLMISKDPSESDPWYP